MRKKTEETVREKDNLNTQYEKELNQEEEQMQQEVETSRYTILEFCHSSQKIFGTGLDAVRVALINGGKSEYTVSEAQKLVKAYIERRIR